MRKRSKKILKPIKPTARIKPAIKWSIPAEEEEVLMENIGLNMPVKIKSRWTAGTKRDRQVQSLTNQKSTIEPRLVFKSLLQSHLLCYEHELKTTRLGHKLNPFNYTNNDFNFKLKQNLAPFKLHTRIYKNLPYDIFFNKEELKAIKCLKEEIKFNYYLKEKENAFKSTDLSLKRRYLTAGKQNIKFKTIFKKINWKKIRKFTISSGLARSKNSCFLLGRSRTFNRKLGFARHTTRKLIGFGLISSLKHS